jgi:AAHS family 4-hydroxybenzoate transporter-like MFS transporter
LNDDPRALSVSEMIDERPLSSFQISIILLCGLVLVLDGFNSQSIGFLAPPISESLGIPLKTFGPIFASGLFGLMVGALGTGPVADRWGRKWVIVVSTLTFAIFTLLTVRATSFDQLLILRFLTGLGLGGAMPNVVALTCEYAPKRMVSVVVGILMSGMPLGLVVGGLVSTVMIPMWGWRSVFYAGGIMPIIVSLILIKWLPESVRFLTVHGSSPKKISRILARISPELENAPINREPSRDHRRAGIPVKYLFTEGRAAGTILLWVPFFMNLLTLYFVVSWLPALLRQSAMPISAGVAAVSLFSVGGVIGSVAQGPLMNRYSSYVVLLAEFGLSTVLGGSLAFLATSFWLTVTASLILGGCVTGAQSGLNALAASFYPTSVRSTGVGWALGIGRIGSIVGPVLGGIMLSMNWSPQQILLAGASPSVIAAIAVVLSNRLRGDASTYHQEPGASHV